MPSKHSCPSTHALYPSIYAIYPSPSMPSIQASLQALLCPLSKPFYALYPSPSVPSIQASMPSMPSTQALLCPLSKPFYALHPFLRRLLVLPELSEIRPVVSSCSSCVSQVVSPQAVLSSTATQDGVATRGIQPSSTIL